MVENENNAAPTAGVVRVVRPRVVGLVSSHLPGDGCMCGAYGESECGCPNVDWRSRREVSLESALEYCLKKLKTHHRSRTGITETIRNTEAIRDAGTISLQNVESTRTENKS